MKKKYIYIASILLIGTFLLIKVLNLISAKKSIDNNLSTIPIFSFSSVNLDTAITPNDLKTGNLIINYFSTDCDHCQYMATSFFKNSTQLKNVKIIMVTADDKIKANAFIKAYSINLLPNITVLLDTKKEFLNKFGTSIIPSFFVYKDNKLLKKILGETKIANLIINE